MLDNIKIHNLHQNIMQDIATVNLPVGTVYYILKDIYQEIEQLYQQQVLIEQQENNEDE